MAHDDDDLPLLVFLDTQIYRALTFDWSASTFISLRERVRRGSIELVTTDIVKREVYQGIKVVFNDFLQQLVKGLHRSGVARCLNDPRINALEDFVRAGPSLEQLTRRADEFFAELEMATLQFPQTALQEVFDLYFSGSAPFGAKNKKSEFPDAVNAITLLNHARCSGRKIVVVSDDGDWKRTCEQSDILVHLGHLSEVLDRAIRAEWRSVDLFPDEDLMTMITAKKQELITALEMALSSASRVNLGDGTLDELRIDNIDIHGFAAMGIWETSGSLNIRGELFHNVDYFAAFSIYDEELMNNIQDETSGNKDLTAELDVSVQLDGPFNVHIHGAEYRDGLELEVPLKFD